MATGTGRRDFLTLATVSMGVAGCGLGLWPFIDSMNPAADTKAMASTEIDPKPIAVGSRVSVQWRGKPVFVAHRTPQEIAAARKVNLASLRDPEPDEKRAPQPEWLIMVGVCTHLGCVPLGQKPADPRGELGGWFCPCHGSVYDTSGRIVRGPAPKNLEIPPYAFTDQGSLKIG
jgi:ubiquinol-cytochrome c reductase iron-sulfur subunit